MMIFYLFYGPFISVILILWILLCSRRLSTTTDSLEYACLGVTACYSIGILILSLLFTSIGPFII